MSEVEIGSQVFWIKYNSDITTGKVIATKKPPFNGEEKACIETGDGWETVELRRLYPTKERATLEAAMQLQTEASSKLQTAARLFKDAGVMSQEKQGP